MILAIDIGGTKTLCTVFDDNDNITETTKFATPQDYREFLTELPKALNTLPNSKNTSKCVVGAPGILDRKAGMLVVMGNLGWAHMPLLQDIKDVVKIPTFIENDAKLAGLYEATILGTTYKKVLYITISTGIGIGLTTNGKIDLSVSDAGGKGMFFEHNGVLEPWENFASGKAIFNEYGMRASDIEDPKVWEAVTSRLVEGFIELITLTTPDIISIGGGVGAHFEKFEKELNRQLSSYASEFVVIPPIVKAKNPEEAVVYGCLEYAKQQ